MFYKLLYSYILFLLFMKPQIHYYNFNNNFSAHNESKAADPMS